MGATRFNELQRGLSHISPTILTKRLNDLANCGIVLRKKIPGQKASEYFLTERGMELESIVMSLGEWGMRWARGKMDDSDLDLELLMLYLQRSVQPEKLPGKETVIRFYFTDVEKYNQWWLVAADKNVDVCVRDPGKEVDIYFTTDLPTMIQLWMGDINYKSALSDDRLKLVGPSVLTRDINSWLKPSVFSDIPPPTSI